MAESTVRSAIGFVFCDGWLSLSSKFLKTSNRTNGKIVLIWFWLTPFCFLRSVLVLIFLAVFSVFSWFIYYKCLYLGDIWILYWTIKTVTVTLIQAVSFKIILFYNSVFITEITIHQYYVTQVFSLIKADKQKQIKNLQFHNSTYLVVVYVAYIQTHLQQ